MIGSRIALYVRKAKRSAIPPPAKMENECIAVPQAMPMQSLQAALRRGRRLLTTHIGQEHLDLAEQLRKTRRGKEMHSLRKETIERVFADAKEKHGMRYTRHRGLAGVSTWVRLKFAAMNLKKSAFWPGKFLDPSRFSLLSFRYSSDSLLLLACFVCFLTD